jgi:hypothetical protein
LIAALLCACTEPHEETPASAAPSAAPTQAQAEQPSLAAAADAAAATISGDGIREVIAEIADDRYAGRAPGSAGDKMTRTYLAAQLERIGFTRGAPDGGWEQPVELVGITSAMPSAWPFVKGEETIELARGQEFIAASGVQAARAEISDAELVFAGYGIEAPEYQWTISCGRQRQSVVMLNNDRLGSSCSPARAALLRPLVIQI